MVVPAHRPEHDQGAVVTGLVLTEDEAVLVRACVQTVVAMLLEADPEPLGPELTERAEELFLLARRLV